MDLMYSRYSNPEELMHIYINQGRFGELVSEIVKMENERKRREAEKEDDNKLWLVYLMSASDKSFSEWKKELVEESKPVNYSMSNEQVDNAKQKARGILKNFSPQ